MCFHTIIFEMRNAPLVHEEDTGDSLSHKHAGFLFFFSGLEMSGADPIT